MHLKIIDFGIQIYRRSSYLQCRLWVPSRFQCPEFHAQVRQESHRQNLDPLWHPWISCTWDYPGSSCLFNKLLQKMWKHILPGIMLDNFSFSSLDSLYMYSLTFPLPGSRSQQGSWLVGSWNPSLRNARRLSALLWFKSFWSLWEDPLEQGEEKLRGVSPLISFTTTRLFGLAIRSTPSQGT